MKNPLAARTDNSLVPLPQIPGAGKRGEADNNAVGDNLYTGHLSLKCPHFKGRIFPSKYHTGISKIDIENKFYKRILKNNIWISSNSLG